MGINARVRRADSTPATDGTPGGGGGGGGGGGAGEGRLIR